jgi:hypothetical protein
MIEMKPGKEFFAECFKKTIKSDIVYTRNRTRVRRGLRLKEQKAKASEGDSETLILFLL